MRSASEGPGSGRLAACCGSVCPVTRLQSALCSLPKARYVVIGLGKNGTGHTLMDPGLLCSGPSTPPGPWGGWLRCGLQERLQAFPLPLTAAAAAAAACGQPQHDCLQAAGLNERGDPAVSPPLSGPQICQISNQSQLLFCPLLRLRDRLTHGRRTAGTKALQLIRRLMTFLNSEDVPCIR